MKRIVVIPLCFMLFFSFIPTIPAENSFNDSGPELETHIISGFYFPSIQVHVKNIGDSTAHNVRLDHVVVEGLIVCGFDSSNVWEVDIDPDEMTILDPNSMIIGFGIFMISMTVTCDEGTSSTAIATGLIFGPFVFIP